MLRSTEELTTRAQREGKHICFDGPPEERIFCDLAWTSEADRQSGKKRAGPYRDGRRGLSIMAAFALTLRLSVEDNGSGIPRKSSRTF